MVSRASAHGISISMVERKVEHMLKAWAISGVMGDKAAHKDCPDLPLVEQMSLEDLEAFTIADDAMDPIVKARFVARAAKSSWAAD